MCEHPTAAVNFKINVIRVKALTVICPLCCKRPAVNRLYIGPTDLSRVACQECTNRIITSSSERLNRPEIQAHKPFEWRAAFRGGMID